MVADAKENLRIRPGPFWRRPFSRTRARSHSTKRKSFSMRADTPARLVESFGPAGGGLLEGIPGIPRKGPAAARHRRMAAGPGEVCASSNWRWTPIDSRPKPGRCAGGIRSRTAGHVCDRAPALEPVLPRPCASAGRRGRPARNHTAGAGPHRAGPRQTGEPDARVRKAVAQIKEFIRRGTFCAARTRSLPGHRDAGISAGKFDWPTGQSRRRSTRRPTVIMPSVRRPRTGSASG